MCSTGEVPAGHFPADHPLAFMNGLNFYKSSPYTLHDIAGKFLAASIHFIHDESAFTMCLTSGMRLHAVASLRESLGCPDAMDIREFLTRLSPSSDSVN